MTEHVEASVLVRSPRLSDVDRLAEINIVTWQHAYRGMVPGDYLDGLDPEAMRERWRTNLTEGRPGVSFLVGELDGVVASYAIVGGYRRQEDAETDDVTDGWGEVYAIYTDPALQGRGSGTAVLEAALDLLRTDGFSTAALWVLVANVASQRWYAARGWRPDGVTSSWSGSGVPLQELRMVRSLAEGTGAVL